MPLPQHFLSAVKCANIKKRVVRIVVVLLVSGLILILVTVVRSPWSSNVELSDTAQFPSRWEQMFQSATNAVLGNTNTKRQPNCLTSTADWDALLDSDTVTSPQLVEYFMWTNQSSCKLSHDFDGFMMDSPSGLAGQKAVCIDPEVAPKPGDCLVYSFGINDNWSFDEQMSAYGCQVYAFNPSMGTGHHNHSPGNIHFYNWGLGSRDEYDHHLNWTIHSLSTVYKKLSTGHGRRIIDYLKIDIEYSEWIALSEIIASGMLSNVRQLGMEVVHLNKLLSFEQHVVWAKLLRSIEKTGMVRFDSEYNPWWKGDFTQFPLSGPLGYEIAWYNGNLSRVLSSSVIS